MDQTPGAGHHALTHMAVHELFASKADSHGFVHGYTEHQFFHLLDAAQEHQDRWYGPTTHPAYADPWAQKEHAMASPYMSGLANLQTDRDFIVGELDKAHAAHAGNDTAGEIKHLGAAAHALEDSYSGAHAFRDLSVYSGNSKAHIEAFNVFDPVGVFTHGSPVAPVSHVGEGTHDARFDVVPVNSDGNPILPDHQAGAQATADVLKTYFDHRDESGKAAHQANLQTVDQFFQPSVDGVHVHWQVTDAWKHERDDRLMIRDDQLNGYHHQQPHVPEPHPPAAPVAPFVPVPSGPNDGGAPIGGTSQAHEHGNQGPQVAYASNAAAGVGQQGSVPGDGSAHSANSWSIPYHSHVDQSVHGQVTTDDQTNANPASDGSHAQQPQSTQQTPAHPHESTPDAHSGQPSVAYASNDHSSQQATVDQQQDHKSGDQQVDHTATATTHSSHATHAADTHEIANMTDMA